MTNLAHICEMLEFFILPYVACLNFNSIFNPSSPPIYANLAFQPNSESGAGRDFSISSRKNKLCAG